jgi:YegS/Rv2252/BmrU family lipid kinase
VVIVCGGDGTIHQALQFTVPARRKIAILPAGTVNVLARELGLPMRLDEAVKVAVGGRTKRIRLGESGGRYFHLMAGIGLDGVIIENVRPRLKGALGQGAYWVSGLTAFWKYRLDPFPVILDGQGFEATFAVIANARNYGGQLILAPSADLGDPYLDACLFTARSRRRYVRYLLAAFKGKHVFFPDVTYRKARTVEIPATRDLPVQMDGDVVGRLPVSIRSYEPGVEVVVPA